MSGAGWIGAALALGALVACTMGSLDARVGVNTPDRAQFAPVNAWLTHRCGSLDCHGKPQRNLVVWGCEGLRLDPNDSPGCRRMGGADTTDAELDATYRSVVGLEPAVMSAVVSTKGQRPDLLTLVRKARGEEAHKGGALVVPGDPQDRCLTSWLAGSTDADACTKATEETP